MEGLLWLSEWLGWPVWHKGYAVLTAVAVVGVTAILTVYWIVIALNFGWRFQFGVRSLLVLGVVVTLPCSWLATEMKNAREQRKSVEAIKKLNCDVRYDWELDVDGYGLEKPEPPATPWLRNLMGTDFFASIVSIRCGRTENANAVLERLKELPHTRWLSLAYSQITDDRLERIKGMTQLQILDLESTQITDNGLQQLKRFSQLQELNLGNDTKITDDGLKQLQGIVRLTKLNLSRTRVTDSGLKYLAGLAQLHDLDLDSTQITDTGLESLVGLAQLQYLNLDYTDVSDAGLKYLGGLKELEVLQLYHTRITDAGLERLYGLTRLHLLEVRATKVTESGVKKLQQSLPKFQVNWEGI